ncbi:flippase [Thermodesulfovibrio sp. 3907-1M]|uniref:Flippase n=1 Tax=Thermodesulfovibrio autotrophicus TaxID=3118333 RepID=A0AAU8GZV7_9BACT
MERGVRNQSIMKFREMRGFDFSKTHINFIKVISDDKKRLFSNFLSLSTLQAANYIFPLITLPYLVRVLGPEKFGLIAFAQAFIMYFNILTDYGFNLSATREIAIHRENKDKVSEIFSSVMLIKFGLLLLSFIIMSAIVFSFEKFKRDWLIYYLTFGMVVGQTLFPVWFFQGMERMKYITFLNILAKLIFTLAIFAFVRQASDYIYVPLINSLGFIVAGVLALWIIFKDFNIKFYFTGLEKLKYQLKEGWHIFVSTIGINMYKMNSVLVLGIFSDNTTVGYFSIAKRLMDTINSLNSIISQSIYPYTARQIPRGTANSFLRKIGIIIALYTSIIGFMLIFFSDFITKILAGQSLYQTSLSIKLLALVPLVIGVNVPAVHILLGKRKDFLFTRAVILGGFLDLLLNFMLVPYFSYIGSCISVIVTETFVTLMLYWYALDNICLKYLISLLKGGKYGQEKD